MYDVVILTEAQYVSPENPDWYVDQILLEDRLVQEALEARGLQVCRQDWASTSFDWNTTKSVLFRATWDYQDRYPEFQSWLSGIRQKVICLNSADIIEWNIDKFYLRDLREKGVRIPPTEFFATGSSVDLEELIYAKGWQKAVIKPTISAAARHTYAFSQEESKRHGEILNRLLQSESMMVQEFQNNIVSKGEVSMMVFGDRFSHAILKKAKSGDFRVQDDYGGSVHPYSPSQEEIEFALKAVQACPEPTAYARVDIFYDNDNEIAVGELELIEPELWFREDEKSAELLAEEIVSRLNN